jgi:hypothetical protein
MENQNKEKETPSKKSSKAELYTRYPLSAVLIYNGTTILHYLLGGIGILLGYNFSWAGTLFGYLYLSFSFVQMYLIMPFTVCPNCVYYRIDNSLCTSGLNLLSKRIAKEGDLKNFQNRGKGLFCHNNLYMVALIIPIIAMIPALVVNFSFSLLAILLGVIGLLLFRFFVVFTKTACIHCRAKYECPNAEAMGIRNT